MEEIDQNAHLEGSSLLRSIVKTDISRLNYLLTEYLKVRREKIQKYYFHIQQELPIYESRLSQAEINFLQDYYQMANKLIIQTGELEDFIAKKQKLFDYPIEPQNSGAFFLLNEHGKLSITKGIEPEQLASILQKQSQLK